MKKIFGGNFRPLLVALVLVAPNLPCPRSYSASCLSLPAGAVSWWRAETNALDATGVDNGTLFGNATYGPGRVGQAFVFDGQLDGVRLGAPTNLQLQDF